MRRKWIVLLTLVFVGCKAMSDTAPGLGVAQATTDELTPTVSIESIDNSVMLGTSFPVVVEVTDAPINEQVSLEFVGDGITPSVTEAVIVTDSTGFGSATIQGVADRAKLTMLAVTAYTSVTTPTDILYVDFPEPPINMSDLSPQQSSDIGTPITVETFFEGLPTVAAASDVESNRQYEVPAFYLQGVRYLDESGALTEPIDAVEFHTGSLDVGSPPPSDTLGTAAACPARESTYLYLKASVSGSVVPIPTGTRVRIFGRQNPTGSSVSAVKYVGSNGMVTFDLACDNFVTVTLEGYTNHGLTIHPPFSKIYTWSTRIYGTPVTADSLRGRTINFSNTTASSTSNLALTVWYRINQVYNWERVTPNSPYDNDRYAVDIVYPARKISNVTPSRAAIGQAQIVDGDALKPRALFHEFGHEVYYRRLIGGTEFERLGREAVAGSASFPPCLGSTEWQIWKYTDGCSGMLEGYALWFESVATRRLGVQPSLEFETDFRPTSRPISAAVPGRVAQYLWDATDLDRDATDPNAVAGLTAEQRLFLSKDYKGSSVVDKIISTTASTDARYAAVARLMSSRPTNGDLPGMFRYSINPKLTAAGQGFHCGTLETNQLGRLYPCQP